MNTFPDLKASPQGFGLTTSERLPIPERDAMSDAQRAAADAIINGPRKALFGPFVPLLHAPVLMERIGKTGEALRFDGTLPERIRELAICVVARETGNQFEWQTHAPLATKAGVSVDVSLVKINLPAVLVRFQLIFSTAMSPLSVQAQRGLPALS